MSALVTYQPTPHTVRRNEPPGDRIQIYTMLLSRVWLLVSWEGLSTGNPRITRVILERDGGCIWRRYRLEVDPARVHILSEAEFRTWYDARWKQFMHREMP